MTTANYLLMNVAKENFFLKTTEVDVKQFIRQCESILFVCWAVCKWTYLWHSYGQIKSTVDNWI